MSRTESVLQDAARMLQPSTGLLATWLELRRGVTPAAVQALQARLRATADRLEDLL